MRTAVVTGSASGLGAAICARLVADEWLVIGVDQRDAEVVVDLADPSGRSALVGEVGRITGGSLDAVIACAGVGPHVADHGLIVSVNAFGALATLDLLFPYLKGGTAPAAVAVASNSMGMIPPAPDLYAALLADDEPAAREAAASVDGPTVYATTKRAVAVGVRHRAEAWGAAGVRLNAIAPGPVDTPLLQATIDDPELGPHVDLLPIPLGRYATADEIALLAVFLLGPETAYMHGSVLWADGGSDALLRPDVI